MSAHMLHARQNRIIALRTVAARNAEDDDATSEATAPQHSNRANLTIVEGSKANPWQAEGLAAA